ncbi:efflux RND transporter periplasmic adaptor subunit [Novosphingobium sp.]|uniref:efflux RND transporter periplasmic adaptor subunit n=1 Tax=Novosphingobium sp. TaxID=1874826 RepID=UPI0035B08924
MDKRIIGFAALPLAALAGWYWYSHGGSDGQAPPSQQVAPGTIADDQLERLGIRVEVVPQANDLPVGLAYGQVMLAPDGRVAVAVPYSGVAVRIQVIEGQQVRRGDVLGVVRAPDAIQHGGTLARAEADLRLAEARVKRLAQLNREGIVATARVEEAQAQLQQARATVAESRRQLALGGGSPDGSMTLRAPISGRVAKVAVETGGAVDPMTAPFVIENPAAFQVDIQLPEAIAAKVQPGMAIEVQVPTGGIDAKPVIAKGTLLSVGASLDPETRSVPARASLEAVPGVVAGKGVTVVIKAAGTTSGIVVPSSAVTRVDGQAYVFVREGQRFVRRKVTVEAEVGGSSVISAGLKPGEKLAVSGIAELKAMTAE